MHSQSNFIWYSASPVSAKVLVNGVRIMTCASRGHFPSKLYSASCGCKHAAGLSRLHLLGRDSVVRSAGSLLVFLQLCPFSSDTKRRRSAALAAAEGRVGAGCGFSTADSSRPRAGWAAFLLLLHSLPASSGIQKIHPHHPPTLS